MNRKIKPAVKVTMLRSDGPRYKPEQLASAMHSMVAPTVSPAGGTDDGAGDIVVDAATEPPAEKFQQLLTRKPKFRALWEHSRTDRKDQSSSAYDMSLACFAMGDGWSRQEIVDLLIAHRRHHSDDLKLRVDYYARTVDKARTRLKARSAPTQQISPKGKKGDESQEARLMAIASAIEVFRSESRQTYPTLPPDAGYHTVSLKDGALHSHLRRSFYNAPAFRGHWSMESWATLKPVAASRGRRSSRPDRKSNLNERRTDGEAMRIVQSLLASARMRRIFIGDIQGCSAPLDRLLLRLALRSDHRVYCVGDLVNRGPDSLGVLRRAREIGARSVLGPAGSRSA